MVLSYLDRPMTKHSFQIDLLLSILAIFSGKQAVKVGPKVQTFGPSFFRGDLSFSNIIVYLYLKTTSDKN